jgi:hypothetical protein
MGFVDAGRINGALFSTVGFREVREAREDSSPNYEPTFLKKRKQKRVLKNSYGPMSQKLPELPGAMQTTDFGPWREPVLPARRRVRLPAQSALPIPPRLGDTVRSAIEVLAHGRSVTLVSDLTFGDCAVASTGAMWYIFQADSRHSFGSKVYRAISACTLLK